MKLPLELLKNCEERYNPSEAELQESLASIKKKSAKELDGASHYEKRMHMLASVAVEAYQDAFERYIGNNDLLPMNYLEIGSIRSKAVGRIHYMDKEVMKPAVATGFLISPDLIMTNHHVFSDPGNFEDPIIEFDYEYDIYGKERTKITFNLNPDKFFYTSKGLDMSIIGVESKDNTSKVDIKSRGYLILNGDRGKVGKGDFACIIQHPDGKPKQVALRENKIENLDLDDYIVYKSDTTVGSSGSPVFNDQWQVIALHSAGVAKKNANGEFVDKDDNVIPVEDERVDASKIVWLNNQGTRVSSMIKLLKSDGQVNQNPFILRLFDFRYSDQKGFAELSYPVEASATEKSSTPSFTTPDPGRNVTININLADGKVLTTTEALSKAPAIVLEEKKYEDELDFSDCSGFDENFLGEHVPLPELSKKLMKKVAHFVDNPNRYVLHYHHFSTIQHAVRRMPIVAAINIHGAYRYAELTGRNDKWYRDNRIDYDVQLNDEFYKKSGFDKGHMCRREDAEWGRTMNFAELAANLTCSYTNACPQVPALNRAKYGGKGKWGLLESQILEEGIKKDNERFKKISVFNGPVFNDDDPVYKGVQIPLHHWKLVVWFASANQMKATAYLLHQNKLVGDIAFEKLRFDEVFKTSQCSIAYLETLTDLDFGSIKDLDTYQPSVGDENERLILDE